MAVSALQHIAFSHHNRKSTVVSIALILVFVPISLTADAPLSYPVSINISAASFAFCQSSPLSDCLRCPMFPDTCGARASDSASIQFRGGVHIASAFPHFGGLSDLRISADGVSLLAVSDRGWLLAARLLHDSAGRLIGVDRARMAPLLDPAGRPLDPAAAGGRMTDAEGMAATNRTHPMDGDLLISFEGVARGVPTDPFPVRASASRSTPAHITAPRSPA